MTLKQSFIELRKYGYLLALKLKFMIHLSRKTERIKRKALQQFYTIPCKCNSSTLLINIRNLYQKSNDGFCVNENNGVIGV